MGFADAVKEFYGRYVDFEGRSSRGAFWWAVLYLVIGNVVCYVLDLMATGGILGTIFGLANFIPQIALSVRRLHDTSKTGWLTLLNIIPIIGFLILTFISYVKKSDPPNEYGPVPAGATPADGGSARLAGGPVGADVTATTTTTDTTRV